MTKYDDKRENCDCLVCRSDVAYLHPCDNDNEYMRAEDE